jgi:hypothetical protein
MNDAARDMNLEALQMAGMFLGYVIEALRDLPIAGICFMN